MLFRTSLHAWYTLPKLICRRAVTAFIAGWLTFRIQNCLKAWSLIRKRHFERKWRYGRRAVSLSLLVARRKTLNRGYLGPRKFPTKFVLSSVQNKIYVAFNIACKLSQEPFESLGSIWSGRGQRRRGSCPCFEESQRARDTTSTRLLWLVRKLRPQDLDSVSFWQCSSIR